MDIGGIKAAESVSGGYGGKVQPVDSISKSIQNEISGLQRKKQELASKEDMSVEEKAKKRQELQQELGSLNTRLRRRQAEARREQRKEMLAEQMRAEGTQERGAVKQGVKADAVKAEETKPDEGRPVDAKAEESKDQVAEGRNGAVKDAAAVDGKEKDKGVRGTDKEEAGTGWQEMQPVVAEGFAMEQSEAQGTVIARMEDGIVILKGEIRQDEVRGGNVEKKKEELEQQEERLQRAYRFPPLEGDDGKNGEAARKPGDPALTVQQGHVFPHVQIF